MTRHGIQQVTAITLIVHELSSMSSERAHIMAMIRPHAADMRERGGTPVAWRPPQVEVRCGMRLDRARLRRTYYARPLAGEKPAS